MKKSKETLFGNVPEKASVALLLIDVINDFDFADHQSLLRHAFPMAKRLAQLKEVAKRQQCAIIYVNDNFGRWRSDFKALVQHCLCDDVPGKGIVQLLQPDDDDYFVLKPAHSGFYSTTLDLLLTHLEARTLIISGVATNICVQFTANDAFLRGYKIVIPADCVAANSKKLTRDALAEMETVLKTKIYDAKSIPWKRLIDNTST